MRRLLLALPILALAACNSVEVPAPCGPVPTQKQLDIQDMETYAFIHYSLNTYTDEEWGYGNEALELFNPANLDTRQWVRTCKAAGMKGIIFTAKHHCGFCMWPSAYTEYSVKNTPWKDGKGDVVKELAEACREEGLKLGIYLSPWDRNHAEYGYEEYITYFRNQLEELLTNYGDVYEIWFDGANGGNGWYGGADETRKIDRTTYYQWPGTYELIRQWQPNCIIWNDGGLRGEMRWVGTEAGYIGETNWSLLYQEGDVPFEMLHYGVEDGDVWVSGETNTSIRPGWFYHTSEDAHVKSLSKLMQTYYRSVGRNSTMLINFPITPDGLIHPTDSIRGAAFANMVKEVFDENLAAGAKATATSVRGDSRRYAASKAIDGRADTYWTTDDGVTEGALTLSFAQPVTFNRVQLSEYITLGQRVKSFTIEALVDGQWQALEDQLTDDPARAMTTIGRKRILCVPETTAEQVRVTITDSKACPLISEVGLYLAPEIAADPENGEVHSWNYNMWSSNTGLPNETLFIFLPEKRNVTGFRFLPDQTTKENMPLDYRLFSSVDGRNWTLIAEGEFSNIVNNPIWQNIKIEPCETSMLKMESTRLTSGNKIFYTDVEVLSE